MLAVFNVDEGNLSRMETFLSTTTSDTDYQYESKSDLKTEFESMKKTISLMGYTLSVIVGFLGISNFLNTIITSIMSRKREIAVLQSLGMTRKQTRRLLSFEGLIYLFAAFVFSVTVGSLIGYLGVSVLLGESGYLDLHFSVLPTFICLPILMILSPTRKYDSLPEFVSFPYSFTLTNTLFSLKSFSPCVIVSKSRSLSSIP